MRSTIKDRARWKNERDLLDFARVYLSEAFPNPEREGCPADEELRILATKPTVSNRVVGEHATLCSPCFKAYMAHLERASDQSIQDQESRHVSWAKISVAALAAVTVFLVTVYSFIDRRHSKQIVATETPASVVVAGTTAQHSPASDVAVLIDLISASPTRGAEQSTDSGVQTLSSHSPLALSIRLPFGSDEGLYSITVSTGRNVVWSASARAFRRNGETLLSMHADLTRLHTGKYDLQVTSPGRRLRIPVLITEDSPRSVERKP